MDRKQMLSSIISLTIAIVGGAFVTIFSFEYSSRKQPRPTISYTCSMATQTAEGAMCNTGTIHTAVLENTGTIPIIDLDFALVFPKSIGVFPPETLKVHEFFPITKPKHLFTDTSYTLKDNRISATIKIMNPGDRYEALVIDNWPRNIEVYARAPGLILKNDSTVAIDEKSLPPL